MSAKKWGPDVAALRHRDFALYVSANFLTTIALQIQATALAWQIYAITGRSVPARAGRPGGVPACRIAGAAGWASGGPHRSPAADSDRGDGRVVRRTGAGVPGLDRSHHRGGDPDARPLLRHRPCDRDAGGARPDAQPDAEGAPRQRGRLVLDQLAGRDDRRTGRRRLALFGHRRPARSGNAAMAYGGAALGFVGAVLLFFLMRGRPVAVVARNGRRPGWPSWRAWS